MRAAVVATTPAELATALQRLQDQLARSETRYCDVDHSVFIGSAGQARIAFLFSGQTSPVRLNGGALARRFPEVQALYECAALPVTEDTVATAVAQPAIVTAELSGLAAAVLCQPLRSGSSQRFAAISRGSWATLRLCPTYSNITAECALALAR